MSRINVQSGRKLRQTTPAAQPDAGAADQTFLGELLGAITLCATIVAAANGEIADEESEAIAAFISGFTDGETSEQGVRELIDACLEALDSAGPQVCMSNAASKLKNKSHATKALEIAAIISVVDGEVNPEEKATYFELAEALGFPEKDADKIARAALAALDA